MKCIDETKNEVLASNTRQAFYEYLDEAPEVKRGETDDPTKCGELRTYFEYDANFPDDNRICNEVRELQVWRLCFETSSCNFGRLTKRVLSPSVLP